MQRYILDMEEMEGLEARKSQLRRFGKESIVLILVQKPQIRGYSVMIGFH